MVTKKAPAKLSTTKKKPFVPKKPVNKKYVVKMARLWHPDQKVYIDKTPVELKIDSWTEAQLNAGLLIEV